VDYVCNKANVVRSFFTVYLQTMSIKCKGKMLSSVSAMLNKLNWASLKERRDTLRLAMLYKIVNNLVESYVT